MPEELLSPGTVEAELANLNPDWAASAQQLHRVIEFADFPAAVEFVNRIAPRCEELDHHPDLALRWRTVDVTLTTHDAGGVTGRDLELARIVDEVAAGLPQVAHG